MRFLAVAVAFALLPAVAEARSPRQARSGKVAARSRQAGRAHEATKVVRDRGTTDKDNGGKRKSGKGKKDVAKKLPPPVTLEHLSTRETFTLQPDAGGHVGAKQMRSLRRFLRCHHTGRTHAMSARLLEIVYRAARHFEARHAYIVAGYRAPKVAKKKGNPRSHHKQGLACDFRLDGVGIAALRDHLRTYGGVGVGYYPNSRFVHLDVNRKKSAFWIDYSGPGERAKYAEDPETDLETGRADDTGGPGVEDADGDIEELVTALPPELDAPAAAPIAPDDAALLPELEAPPPPPPAPTDDTTGASD